MPLLPKEQDVSSDAVFALSPLTHPWAVAHVRSRQEKVLARHLAQGVIDFYLPQIEQRTRRSGRTFVSHLPLFPGYVFFRGARNARDVVWRSDVAANIIDVPDQEQLTRELRQLFDLQRSGASLIPEEELVPGDPIRITAGSFRGYTGVLLHDRGHDRLVIAVTLLHRQVSVEFPREAVRKR